ncbi:MAG: hypothetical protein QOD32_2020 [Pyrinomonadaceae bacterium]|jgi:hypothetical protein|nr:hypothetical protein [Pyrinomonadaceae bacterium]
MKLRLCCLALALFALAPATLADISAPEPKPTPTPQKVRRAASLPAARMLIESRKDATEARLQIPQNVLRQLRAELEREDASGASSSATATDWLRPTQTIVAGVFLSLSLAFAGVFVARTRSRVARQAAAVALFVFAASGALAFKTLANARPPEPRLLDAGSLRRATTPDAELNGVIRVEVVDDPNVFKLIVPANTAAGTE